MNADKALPLSQQVIGCAIEVHRSLGQGFLERIYEEALAIELRHAGIRFEQQRPMEVHYRGEVIGAYCSDFLIDNSLILELKALTSISTMHEAQILNYLKASGIGVGLILNFGAPRLGIKRMALRHNEAVHI